MTKILEFIANNYIETLLSAFVAFITYKQWKTEEEKKRLELLEKRYDFYQEFMLNRLWNTLFYKKDQLVSTDKNIEVSLISLKREVVYKAEFLFEKRIYDKIFTAYLKLHYLCGFQCGINDQKARLETTVQESIKELEDETIIPDIKNLKNDYENLLDELYCHISVEDKITIWRLIKNIVIRIWDFFIPYRSKKIERDKLLYEENMDFLKIRCTSTQDIRHAPTNKIMEFFKFLKSYFR